jgi:hypothetical protein
MRYQIRKSKETNTVELKRTDLDGAVDKTKLNIYEDGTDEEFLKLVKEFQNYVSTYEIWNDEHASHTVYKALEDALPELQETFGIKLTCWKTKKAKETNSLSILTSEN